jgi:predicted TIM-barrel fold metal-dependent hydrolase
VRRQIAVSAGLPVAGCGGHDEIGSRQIRKVSILSEPEQRTHERAGKRIVVDSQVHIWRPETPDRKWVPGRPPQLPEPLGYDKLLTMMDGAGVDRVVIVPPSWEGERNDYGLEAAARHPQRFGVMGRLALNNPASAARVPNWKAQPGMLGIRLTFNGPEVSWLTDGTADWFWHVAARTGVPVMVLGGIMAEFGRIAERHPELRLIIDHMGLLLRMGKEGTVAENIERTAALARFPNVSVKLSSVPPYSSEPYPFRDVAGYVQRVFDAFGPQRCYWGTDMTNSFDKATYRERVTHFTEELSFLSEQDKDWVMGRAILKQLDWA